MNAQDTKNFKLDRCQVVEQIVEFGVFLGLLDALVDCDDELVCLIYGQLSLGIDDCVEARLNELLLKQVQILEITLFIDEIVLQ